ncbi:FecR family protein [Vreelandella venusta]|uniref:FecR family protein n=1 Tax=Vreelandella venusta TaxID=44935 RepID=UPI003850F3AC
MKTPSSRSSASPTPGKLSEQSLREAAQWCITLADDSVDNAQRRDFERWLAHQSEHQHAWEAMRDTWAVFTEAEQPGLRDTLEHAYQQERSERRRLLGKYSGTAVLVISLVTAGWWLSGTASPMQMTADHYTAQGERKTVALADGSILTLDTSSAIDVQFSPERRQITLRNGRLFIDVAPDPQRALEVVTPEGTIRALGTAFSVYRTKWKEEPATRVTVYESRVEVCPENTHCQEVGSGNEGNVTNGTLSYQPRPLAATPDWTSGVLILDNQPLTEVLDELARYYRGTLRYGDESLSGLTVSGVLPLNSIEHALTSLTRALPIETQRFTPWVTIVKRNEATPN